MHIIQCECGKFQAELTHFPEHSPGRLACYCDDCQTYLHALGREDLLDSAGGTEVIPVYPADCKILSGQEVLKCNRLSPNGLYRWSTTCCNTPIANTRPGLPWLGIIYRAYTAKDPRVLENTFGPVRSAIMGRFARGTPPPYVSSRIGFKDMLTVLPFLLKGKLLGRAKPSPFFRADGVTPIVAPIVVPVEQKNAIRAKLGFTG